MPKCRCLHVRRANGIVCLADFGASPAEDHAKYWLRTSDSFESVCRIRDVCSGAIVTDEAVTCLQCVAASFKEHTKDGH
jgi:hypothetical protein